MVNPTAPRSSRSAGFVVRGDNIGKWHETQPPDLRLSAKE